MPSPFPGMDPFIESQAWEDFHGRFVADLADELVPQVRPKYTVRYERRVYVESDPDDPYRFIRPDATILAGEPREEQGDIADTTSLATATVVEVTLPLPQIHQEAFLTIRESETLEVVTVIELLSPANKRPGSDGRREYLRKRDAVLESKANLVELDLLRGGRRLPTVDPLPPGDYYAFVCRTRRRPKADVYSWTLRQPLPTTLIPLQHPDRDVSVQLQELFTARFERSGYDYSLDLSAPLEPPLEGADREWVEQLLADRNG